MTALSPPPQIDIESGLLTYSTGGARHEGRLRTSFQDFRVEELISLEDVRPTKAPGLVPVYQVTKAGVDTPHVAREIAAMIKSEVNYAGLKDKNATVVQYISARSTRAMAPAELRGGRFEARLVGFSRPVTRGMLKGNRFRILVETSEDIGADVEACFRACGERRVANFYGYQRFGLKGGVNRRVGKAIVEKDFARATGLILSDPRDGEDDMAREARRLCGEGRYAEAVRLFSPRQDAERSVAFHLSQKPGDHVGALRRIPIPIRRLLVNSYQSYLFNLALSRAVADGVDLSNALSGDNWARLDEDGLTVGRVHGVKEDVPNGWTAVPLIQIVGYGYRNYGSRLDRVLAEVMEKEGVSPGAFYIKEAEEMSSEGGFRPAPLLSSDLSFKKEERGFVLEFSLGKGEYATVLLREVLKPERPQSMGF
ncbi:MAG TPA: tRNA pseudouridine(13) synthase TruD [Nitrososphaerales archaeon]|nr:tRNA pseudouridine(13) synthase TruD [Nitrososphaerales archaeon]